MKKFSLIILGLILALTIQAQEKLAVVNFDVTGESLTKEQYLSITRSEVSKMGRFLVIDKYTLQEALAENPVDLKSCFGIKCLTKVGQQVKADFVIAGSIEIIIDKAIVSLRLLDVSKGEMVKSSYSEFYWSESNAQRIVQLAVYQLFDKEVDQQLLNVYDYELAKQGKLEGPDLQVYNLTGPRFGGVYQTGTMGDVLKNNKNDGGFDKQPMMTVIGFQHEKQYLYTGSFQAVFQTNFSLTGLDQQIAIPSLNFLNGFRSTKNGWEFGFGPSFRIRKSAEGFYRTDEKGVKTWHLSDEALPYEGVSPTKRLDSRGSTKIISTWIWAIGRTFSAGKMNMPINLYTIPDKDGWLFGISLGYSLQSRKKSI